jgi:hypothetical protein
MSLSRRQSKGDSDSQLWLVFQGTRVGRFIFTPILPMMRAQAEVSTTCGGGAVWCTFMGVSSLTLAIGDHLQTPRAIGLLTAGYRVGQILGPVVAAPFAGQRLQQGAMILGSIPGVRCRCGRGCNVPSLPARTGCTAGPIKLPLRGHQ